jgi:hypothetical protein
MDGITRLWEEFFKIAPGLAIDIGQEIRTKLPNKALKRDAAKNRRAP